MYTTMIAKQMLKLGSLIDELSWDQLKSINGRGLYYVTSYNISWDEYKW
jgi:hypothetical protein